ncbi:MAG: UDP-N-acetylmuramate dehydrogenase [Spirochaetales bacterium]|nr:UDP-N-acetylmuramate dehydrogenase [Spirochaetales bacterium]
MMLEDLESKIEKNVALNEFTTMGVGGNASFFVRIKKEEDIPLYVNWASKQGLPLLILGCGSNMIISDLGFKGLVLKIEISGYTQFHEDDNQVHVTVGAGVIWDDFVEYSVKRGWWGIENMSLIPGTVGALAVQNVGSYGQEAKNVVSSVRVYNLYTKEFHDLSNEECKFRFRRSIFNTTEASHYIITATRFRLLKGYHPVLTRKEIRNNLIKHNDPCFQTQIRKLVIKLRTSGRLLPKPNTYGNSGTFFQASLIPYKELGKIIYNLIANKKISLVVKILACILKHSSSEGVIIPARFFIKEYGLINLSFGSVKLYESSCVVLVTVDKNAQAYNIIKMAEKICGTVFEKSGIIIPIEPVLTGFTAEELIPISLFCEK